MIMISGNLGEIYPAWYKSFEMKLILKIQLAPCEIQKFQAFVTQGWGKLWGRLKIDNGETVCISVTAEA